MTPHHTLTGACRATCFTLVGLGALLFTASATAVPVGDITLDGNQQCTSTGYGGVLSVSDVTDNGSGNALDCFGAFDGNVNDDTVLHFGGDAYTHVDTQQWEEETTSGTWSFAGDTSGWGSYFVALKAANSWGAWYFEVDSDTTFSGDWAVPWTNKHGENHALSHLSIYAKDSVPVPEPTPLALLGLGLILGTLSRWRR